MTRRRKGAMLALLFPLAAAPTMSGCVTNPATGRTTFTGGLSTSSEVSMGREQHPKIVEEFGGLAGSPELQRYVASLGALIARTVERKDITYTFTVLNSPIVNAFALPGGYIYITRGLLDLADSEAELAAVLAHELGHVTALHHAQRQGQTVLANILVAGLGVAVGGELAGLGQVAALGVLQSFSREHEYEADGLGVRYLSRTGHDTRGMARFLSKLRAHSRLEAQLRGEPSDKVDQFDYLATHPAPVERVDRATQLAAAAGAQRDPIVGRDVYLNQIDGLLHGDDPAQGFVRGRVFAHPALRFRFEVPPGFRLFNSPTTVAAFGPEGSRLLFDRARNPTPGPIQSYLTDVWAKGATLSQVETINVNGLDGATGTARGRTDAGVMDVRLVAIRVDARTIYRFLFVTPAAMTARIAPELRRTTYSFRRLSDAELAQLKPLRLRIRTVGPGDTVDSLAARMPFEDFRRERFLVLNGLAPGARLATGVRVKLVTE